MPTWGEIGREIQTTIAPNGMPDVDAVRRSYLFRISEYTGIPVILYATAFLDKPMIPGNLLQIELGDMQGFMEVVKGLPRGPLDLIVHSPGGVAEATESIVRYLRERFTPIRIFVPVVAKSAATMLALSADEIVMGSHSELGPIDPQIPIRDRLVPAQAIIDEFLRAQSELTNPVNLGAWLPILNGYYPGLLQMCQIQQDLSKDMVETWLSSYMFRRTRKRNEKARQVAAWFSNHSNFKSHSRQISRKTARTQGVVITDLEQDPQVQDLVLSVYHATTYTFTLSPAAKIIENNLGRAFIRMVNVPPMMPLNIASLVPVSLPNKPEDDEGQHARES